MSVAVQRGLGERSEPGELTFQVLGVVLFGARHLLLCIPGHSDIMVLEEGSGGRGWTGTHSSAELRRQSRMQIYYGETFSAFIPCDRIQVLLLSFSGDTRP